MSRPPFLIRCLLSVPRFWAPPRRGLVEESPWALRWAYLDEEEAVAYVARFRRDPPWLWQWFPVIALVAAVLAPKMPMLLAIPGGLFLGLAAARIDDADGLLSRAVHWHEPDAPLSFAAFVARARAEDEARALEGALPSSSAPPPPARSSRL